MHASNEERPIMLPHWIKPMSGLVDGCRLAAIVTCLSLLAGCNAMGGKDSILPQEGASMKEIYDAHFTRARQRLNSRESMGIGGPGVGEGNLAGFTREAATEIEALFPRLPNPPLVMYVFPHQTAQGQPVPGYATSFPMYEKTEYALPGETEGRE